MKINYIFIFLGILFLFALIPQAASGACYSCYVSIIDYPSSVSPGEGFYITFYYYGTGPSSYQYEHRSLWRGSSRIGCKYGNASECIWLYDYFYTTAPSTPGTYTYYVKCYGASSQSSSYCDYSDDSDSCTVTVESAAPACWTCSDSLYESWCGDDYCDDGCGETVNPSSDCYCGGDCVPSCWTCSKSYYYSWCGDGYCDDGCGEDVSSGDCYCSNDCRQCGEACSDNNDCVDACPYCVGGVCKSSLVSSPTVTTKSATDIGETSAKIRGYLDDDGGESCRAKFEYGKTSSYGNSTGWSGYIFETGDWFSSALSSLSRGERYHYRAVVQNSAGTDYGSRVTFFTLPAGPSSLSATAVSSSQIDLDWPGASAADYYMVRRKTTGYPTSPSDGSQACYTSSSDCSDTGLSGGTTYYYSVFSRAEDEGYYQYNYDSYASAYATTEAAKTGTKIDCYFGAATCIFDKGTVTVNEKVWVCGILRTVGGTAISGKTISFWVRTDGSYDKVFDVGTTNSSGYVCKSWAATDDLVKYDDPKYIGTHKYVLYFAGDSDYNETQTSGYNLTITCNPTCSAPGAVGGYIAPLHCTTCLGKCGWICYRAFAIPMGYATACTIGTDCYFPIYPYTIIDNRGTSCSGSVTKCQTSQCPNYSGWDGEECTTRKTNCSHFLYGSYGVVNYGQWDASDRKCVQCDVYHKETANCGDTSGIYLECNYGERENAPCTGTADNKCESACGADSFADEQSPNSCSLVNCGYGNSLRLDCYTAACTTYDGPCSSNCGAIDPECDGKNPGDSCGVGGTCDDSCKCIEACTRANPSVSLSPSSQSGNPGDTKSYTASITNNDNAACGDSTFNLTKSCPSGWSCSLSSSSKTISPGSSASVTLSVTSPTTATAGDYTVSVTATNSAATSYSGTDSATYTVIVEAACAPGETEVIMDNFPSDGATVTKTVNAPSGEQFTAGTLSTLYATGDLDSCSSEYFNAYVEGSQINANYCTGYQDCTYHQVDSNVGITSYVSGKASFELKVISSAGTDAGYSCPGTAIKVMWCLDLSSETVVDNPPQITINCPECAPIKNIGDVVSVIVSATDDYGLNQLYLAVRGEQPNPQDFFHPCGGATPCAFSRDITLDYAGTDPDIGDWTFWGNAEDTTGQWGSYVFAGVYDVFDFNLSVSPNSGSVNQGQSISTTVTANLLSSASRSVSFSASGLPSGTSVSFSPASCSPTCDSTMTITTSPTTPTGTYSVTIKGENENLVRETNYNLTVEAAGCESNGVWYDVGDIEIQDCGSGDCLGTKTRTCLAGGTWGGWSDCSTAGNDCGICCLCNTEGNRTYDSTQDIDCSAGGYTCTNPLTCAGHYHQGICQALDSCGLGAEIPDASQCDGLDCGTCCTCASGGIETITYDDFESDWGNWSNVGEDNMDWTRRSGSTPSSNTGPPSAHSGSYYIYTESSSPNYPDKTAILRGPQVNASNMHVNFYYHMYGSAMGSLYLEVSTDGGSNWTSEWSKSGNQGDSWHNADVDLSSYNGETIDIRFRGVTGSSFTSDMALDDITITGTVSGRTYDPTQDIDCSAGGYICDNPLTCSGHYHQGICQSLDTCGLGAEIPDSSQCDGLDCGTCCLCVDGQSPDYTQDGDCSAGGYICSNPLICSGHYHQGICDETTPYTCTLAAAETPDPSQCDGLDCGTCCTCASGRSYDPTQDIDCSAGGYICDNPLTCSGHYHQGICQALDTCGLGAEIPDSSQCDGLDCGEKSDTCDDYCSAKKLVEYNNNCIQDSTLISCDKTCDALGVCQDCTLPSCPSTITHCCQGVCGAGCDDDLDCPGESVCQADCTCSEVCECGPEISICCDGCYWCAPGEVFNGTSCTLVSSTNYCGAPAESCDDAPNCQGSKFYKGCSASHICSDSTADGYIEDYDAACDDESCDDGLWCTINDSCTSGICSGEDQPCGDLNPCTLDSCNEIENKCENIPITECYLGDGSCINGVWYDDHCSDGIQDCDEEGIDCGGVDCSPCCLSIGLAEPVIEPSSPTENTDFTLYCPVSIDITDTLQPDCLNAYATVGDINQCTFLEWQIDTDQAKFTCSSPPAGNYTARCEVITGTLSSCCSEAAKTKGYSVFNQPPYKPTPSPDYPGGVSWDHCSVKALSIPTFHWIYSDSENDPQKFYEIQVNNNTDFSAPKFTYLARSNSSNFKPTPGQVNSWLAEWTDWGDVLYWRVRVNDQEKDSGPDPDHWSDWLESTEFTFSAHAGPWPEFAPFPSRVSLNQVVTFEDNSKCYTSPGNNEFNCRDIPAPSYQWDFDYIEPTFTVDDTTKGNATTAYGDSGNYKVKLRITDDIDTCYSKTETVTVTRPLPEWMEIPPF